MLDDLPTTLTAHDETFYLLAGFGPCDHWIVAYVDPSTMLTYRNFVGHEDTLEGAVQSLKATLSLLSLVA